MAREVEQVVIRDLARLAAQPAPPKTARADEAACRRAAERAQRKLRRLYELYAEGEDDALCDAIARAKREYAQTSQALADAVQQQRHPPDEAHSRRALVTLGSCWARLTAEERQQLVRACVRKIVLQNDGIEVHYAIEGVPQTETAVG